MKEIIRLSKENILARSMGSDGTYTMCELTNILINQLTDELSEWAQNIDDRVQEKSMFQSDYVAVFEG